MCQKISLHWDSQTWQDFEQFCEYKPAETELISCLSDVREPCQLGCKDLTYCTNFNNRSAPTAVCGRDGSCSLRHLPTSSIPRKPSSSFLMRT